MADTFKFELVSPERLLIEADVGEVVVPGVEGDFTVLPDHAPFISTLRPGMLRVPNLNGAPVEIYLRGGFAEVSPTALTVLAEDAIEAAALTPERLAAEVAAAQAVHDSAQTEAGKYRATDVLERLTSLATERS